MKIKNYYENPNILHVNTMENRAYYIPFNSNPEDRTIMLSDKNWKFMFYNNVYEVPETFINGETEKFDTIEVPSCWNILGYAKHQYANTLMPIPFDPPYVPSENPCGAYTKNFEIDDLSFNHYLNFEGVDSCFYVWVNGEFVGYSQVSHSTSEFDITKYLKKGNNILSVLVLKYCDGTYLEDQDKLRMSGIFRDVYILKRPQNHIVDYKVTTDVVENTGFIDVDIQWNTSMEEITAVLYNVDGKILEEKKITGNKIGFKVENAKLWCAETPFLYTLLLKTKNESISQKVGINTIKIENAVIYVNGVAIKFKGVNRHDSNAYTGATISKEQLLHDIMLMKTHNINAIRTSHYPNAPWAMDLYSEYGLYIIDEADMECHNTDQIFAGGHNPGENPYDFELVEDRTYGMICHDPLFEKAILDRIQRCVIRDYNSPCVIMWSMGNESGYGPNLEKSASWIKTVDTKRLVHFESSIYQIIGHQNDLSNIDVYSRMYAPDTNVEKYCKNNPKKPMILCEFSHAMGNGPGDLEDYFEVMYKYKEFTGGFVWEWNDHSVYMGKTVDGKDKFYYGGDFGEFPNIGNFCMDGMIYPNRTPHTGLLEYKNTARPIRASVNQNGNIILSNKYDFINIKDAINVKYTFVEDNEVVKTKVYENLDVTAHGEITLDVEYKIKNNTDSYILLEYIQKCDDGFLKKGMSLGFDQIILSKKDFIKENKSSGSLKVEDTETLVVITGKEFKYTFNKLKGSISQIIKNNNLYLDKTIEYNIWRAPTDNDRKIKQVWKKAGYDRSNVKVYDVEVKQKEDKIKIVVNASLSAVFLQKSITLKIVWNIFADGQIKVSVSGKRDMIFPYLPRFGLRMFLPQNYNNVKYIGYGPYESYVDKRRASYRGEFVSEISKLHEDYIRPQENGSRYDCSKLELSGNNIGNIKIVANGFSFNVSNYSQEQLENVAHNYELKKEDDIILCLDGFMSGIGSGSCGPHLKEKYQVNGENLSFEFDLLFK